MTNSSAVQNNPNHIAINIEEEDIKKKSPFDESEDAYDEKDEIFPPFKVCSHE